MRTLLFAAALAVAAPVAAQSGEVVYDVTRPLAAQLPPQLAAQGLTLPTEQTSRRRLEFVGAVGRTAPVVGEPATAAGGLRVVGMGGASGPVHHVDAGAGAWTRQLDLLGRAFRIVEPPPALAWRLTGEEGEFAGYAVQKAVATDGSTEVEAWFAPGVPVALGPDQYGGLPGLILVLRAGGTTYQAVEVTLDGADGTRAAPAAPTDGEVVTAEAYREIVRERMEALQNYRGAGNVIVIPAN